jgi:hypothetical protein
MRPNLEALDDIYEGMMLLLAEENQGRNQIMVAYSQVLSKDNDDIQ